MIAHTHSKAPPTLRLKKTQLEMYESIFQHQRTSTEEFKCIPAVATANGTLRPLNPPPFSLATLKKRSSIGNNSSTREQVTPSNVLVPTQPIIPANALDSSSTTSSEETEIAALLTSLKKSDSNTHISCPPKRNLSQTTTRVSIPDLEKHFQRDSIPPPIDMTRPIVLKESAVSSIL